jgi:RNA polymerase sigma-70 factor, ECF subfamily
MIGMLITRLEEDDKAYMLRLYKNYYALVRKTIYSMTHQNDDVEDLIDEVFIKLIEKISLIRSFDCCKATAYIVFTVRSVAINYLKHKNVESRHLYYSDDMSMIEDTVDTEEGAERRLVRQDDVELLKNAVSRLPQPQKDLLYFKYILDMSDEEIAKILGIAPNSVRQYLTRARRAAKKLIEREACNDAK